MIKHTEGLLRRPGLIPFIWIHHSHTPTPLLELPKQGDNVIIIDAIEYHSLKLFYSGILSKLDANVGQVDSFDVFAKALRDLRTGPGSSGAVKGKRKAGEVNGHGAQGDNRDGLSIVVTHAERLRSILGSSWTVFTRLAELTGLDVTVALCSSVTWDEVRPPRGDAVEPVILDIPPPTTDSIREMLLPSSTHPLWARFLDLIIPVLSHLIPSPTLELEYISECLWPIYTASLPPHQEQNLLNKPYADPTNPPPPLNVNMKLLTELKHSMSVPLAMTIEELLTRRIGRYNFTTTKSKTDHGVLETCSKFLIVAGYCASYNPPKSDQRLFGRIGVDGKRRRGGATRRAGYGRTRIGKIPQRLLGPKPFTFDRLLALFSALYSEHASRPDDLTFAPEYDDEEEEEDWSVSALDIATRRAERVRLKEREMDQRWDEEVEHLSMSIGLWNLIPELESQGLLKRMSPMDRLDNITMRCEVDYEEVKSIAKELRLTLDEYLYEATS